MFSQTGSTKLVNRPAERRKVISYQVYILGLGKVNRSKKKFLVFPDVASDKNKSQITKMHDMKKQCNCAQSQRPALPVWLNLFGSTSFFGREISQPGGAWRDRGPPFGCEISLPQKMLNQTDSAKLAKRAADSPLSLHRPQFIPLPYAPAITGCFPRDPQAAIPSPQNWGGGGAKQPGYRGESSP